MKLLRSGGSGVLQFVGEVVGIGKGIWEIRGAERGGDLTIGGGEEGIGRGEQGEEPRV